MKYTTLGSSDIKVSAVAMGCWAIGGGSFWGSQDEKDAVAAICSCFDEGINFFDTAEGYGQGASEKLLGKGLGARRKDAVVATKTSGRHLSADQLPAACENSLRRLKTDYIDLYQIHWPNWSIPLSETVGVLRKLREQGKIRALGVSNFGVRDLTDITALCEVASDQLAYSLLFRAIEHRILPLCRRKGAGVLCYSPLFQGVLTGKFARADDVPASRARTRIFSSEREGVRHGEKGCEKEAFAAVEAIRDIGSCLGLPMGTVALAWLLHQPGVTAVLAGARNPDQVKRNAQAADIALAPDTLRRLSKATEKVKKLLGSNPDMWEAVSRIR